MDKPDLTKRIQELSRDALRSRANAHAARRGVNVIRAAVREGFVNQLGFHRQGQAFWRQLGDVMHSASISRGTFGPNFAIEYGATLLIDEDRELNSVPAMPDICGDFGRTLSEIDYGVALLDAGVAIDPSDRFEIIKIAVTTDASNWFAKVESREQLEGQIRKCCIRRDLGYIPLVKGLRKIGMAP